MLTSSEDAEAIVSGFESELKTSINSFDSTDSFAAHINSIVAKLKEIKAQLEAHGLFDEFRKRLEKCLYQHLSLYFNASDIKRFLTIFGIITKQLKDKGLFDSFRVILEKRLILCINIRSDDLKTAVRTMDRSKLENFKVTMLNIIANLEGDQNVTEFVGLIRGELDCFRSIINIVEKFLSGDITDIRSLLTSELSELAERIKRTNRLFSMDVQLLITDFNIELNAAEILQEAEFIIAAEEKPSEEELQRLIDRILATKNALEDRNRDGCIFALQTVEKLNEVEEKLGISKDTITQDQSGQSESKAINSDGEAKETNAPEIESAATNVADRNIDDQALQKNNKKMKIAIALEVISIAASIFFGLAIVNLQFNFVAISYMLSNKLMLAIFSTVCGALAVAAISIGIYIYSIVKLNRQINFANTKKAVINDDVVADHVADLSEDQHNEQPTINT
jgi:hypothetical protein